MKRLRTSRLLVAPGFFLALAGTALAQPSPSSGTVSPAAPLVTWTGNISGSAPEQANCVDNVTCEVFTLTLAAGDYTGLHVRVSMNWLVAANDYDLYIYEDDLNGAQVGFSADFATTGEQAFIAISPSEIFTDRVYAVQAVAFGVAPGDPYAGAAEVVIAPTGAVPNYVQGTLPFSENVTLKAPFTISDGEPSIRVDQQGTCYVGGIRGVPAGVDLWRFDLDPTSPTFDPGMQNPLYLGQPDAFLQPSDPNDPMVGGADGGGDIDISVSFPSNPTDIPVVTITSLAAANISSAVSFDRGVTWQLSPGVSPLPGDDRQWNESTGDQTVYLFYRAPIPATGLFVQRSDDHGVTYPQSQFIDIGSTPGYIDVDQNSGRVYISHQSGSALFVSSSSDGGNTWRTTTVDNSTAHGELFDPIKVDASGNVFVVWSDASDIWMARSEDEGLTWSPKFRINPSTAAYPVNLEPWLEAGGHGRVNVVWYGTDHFQNDNDADWHVFFAQIPNAMSTTPSVRWQIVSDHIIHGSNISTGGLDPAGGANRNLIDYFQVAIDPQGAAVIAFTDDHNDYDGNVFVTRQLAGPSLYPDANGTGLVIPASPPPLPTPDPNDPEVDDFLNDALAGLLQPVPGDHPLDILSVDYDCDEATDMMLATMTVSTLDSIPAGGNWRVSFSANAANGVSDRGDQYFMRLDATDPSTLVWSYGTTVRDNDGGLTNTIQGALDVGTIDAANGTITFGVTFTKLNQHQTRGVIGCGTTFDGLRGQTFTPGVNGILDRTRGGTTFTCNCATSVEVEPERAQSRVAVLRAPKPNPTGRETTVSFMIPVDGWVDLAVFDVGGRRVRSLVQESMHAGDYSRTWDGRTDQFTDAAPGIYFFKMNTASGVQTRKVTLIR